MPLTPDKAAHIQAKIATIMSGRTSSVTLTLKNADGSTSSLTINAIVRPNVDFDPDYDEAGGSGDVISSSDALMLINMPDVTYAQLRACLYVTINSPVNGQLFASRYLPTSITAKGMVPGGTRWIVTLDRQRA